MKKFLFIASLFLGGITSVVAQANVHPGNVRLNFGGGFSDFGIMGYFGADFGVADKVTIGGEFSVRHDSEKYYNREYNNTGFGFMANGNYHYGEHIKGLSSKLDLYGGLSVGYYNWNRGWSGDDYSGDFTSGAVFLGQAGVRYFFSKNWAVNGELHAGSFGGIKAGMTYQF